MENNQITNDDIARHFVNEERTGIHTPKPYPQWRNAATELAAKFFAINTPTAVLVAGELVWYAEQFESWTRESVSETYRHNFVTEFLLTYQQRMSYYQTIQRGGLR